MNRTLHSFLLVVLGLPVLAVSHVLADHDHFPITHLLGAPQDSTGKLLLDFVRRETR
jgi:hypothetical protein